MPPTFKTATTGTALGSSGFSITHSTGSDSNRAIVATVASSSGGGGATTTAATYKSVALEEVIDLLVANDHISGHISTTEPTSGSGSFSFTISAADDEVAAAVSDYYDVNQTTEHGTARSNSGTSTTGNTGAITSESGETCVGAMYAFGVALTAQDTARWAAVDAPNGINAAGAEAVGAASVTIGWTHTSVAWVSWGAPLKPSSVVAPIGIYTGMVPTQRMI